MTEPKRSHPTLVLDASLTMTWYFDDESTAATNALLDRVSAEGAVVPSLSRLEVVNAFQVAIRRASMLLIATPLSQS